jgi:MFS family permease
VATEHRGGAHAEPPPWGQIFTLVGRDLRLFAAVQAGFVRNLADGAAWGLLMLQFTGALGKVSAGNLQWIMIACFAIGQTLAGSLSDTHGRKRFVVAGMALLAAGFATVPAVSGFAAWAAAVALIGVGGSLMYPTVIGAIADQLPPLRRATGLGVYRFWRDLGYAAGALSSGFLADRFGAATAIYAVAGTCAASSLLAAYGLRPDVARLPAATAAATSSTP